MKSTKQHEVHSKGNVKRQVMGLVSKTTTLHVLHAFLSICLPSLHSYDVKWPSFNVYWKRERLGDKFALNPWNVLETTISLGFDDIYPIEHEFFVNSGRGV